MEYQLKLSSQDVQAVVNGLGELPLKVCGSVYGKIVAQVQAQDAAVTQGQIDAAADARDVPSGATKQPDAYAGS